MLKIAYLFILLTSMIWAQKGDPAVPPTWVAEEESRRMEITELLEANSRVSSDLKSAILQTRGMFGPKKDQEIYSQLEEIYVIQSKLMERMKADFSNLMMEQERAVEKVKSIHEKDRVQLTQEDELFQMGNRDSSVAALEATFVTDMLSEEQIDATIHIQHEDPWEHPSFRYFLLFIAIILVLIAYHLVRSSSMEEKAEDLKKDSYDN